MSTELYPKCTHHSDVIRRMKKNWRFRVVYALLKPLVWIEYYWSILRYGKINDDGAIGGGG